MNVIGLIQFLIGVMFFGIIAGCPFLKELMLGNTREDAKKKMNLEELEFLKKLELISAQSTYDDVVSILGQPNLPGVSIPDTVIRPTWLAPGGDDWSRVNVYFNSNKPYKVQWMKFGSFIWIKDFPENRP